MEETIQQKLAYKLYKEISDDFKISNRTRRPDLPEFTTLIGYIDDAKVNFTIGWFDTFEITFRPQTIGVKYSSINKKKDEKETLSKSLPLDQKDLLDYLIDIYDKKSKNKK